MPHSQASSAIIIRDQDDRVFIARRSLQKRYSPGEWEMIGGGMEDGETKEDCIKREIWEELGCGVASLRYLKEYRFLEKIFNVFEIKLDKEPEPKKEDFEEWGWFDRASIERMEFALNCKERLMEYFLKRDNKDEAHQSPET